MKFKKLISSALSLALVLSFLVIPINTEALNSGGFEYKVNGNEVEILSYSGAETSLEIPETIRGMAVTSIGYSAFRRCGFKSVDLPEGLETVGESAFADCKSLVSVSFPSTLKEIGDTAFYNCENLSSALRFPDSLQSIGDSAFEDCWSMTYVIVPESVKEIGYSAFGYYYESDPEDKKYYDYKRSDFTVLGYSDSIASVYAQKHQLDFYALDNGANAFTVNNMDFLVDYSGNAELISYNGSAKSVTIPSEVSGYPVKKIGRLAFYNAELSSVKIPDSVTEVGKWAFQNCEYLAKVKISPYVTTISEGAFGYYYEDGVNYPYLNFTVLGAPNSAAKKYADEVGFEFEDVYTTFLTLNKTSGSLYVKGSLKINVSVKNPSGKTEFSSSNKKVAKVNSSGKITALKAGAATITVKNNKVKKTFSIKVNNPKLNKSKLTLKQGKGYKLKIKGKIGSAKFTSSKKKIVKINKRTGQLKCLKNGKATITVKTNGIKLKCKVKVK